MWQAQKLLDEILEKTTEIVRDPIPILDGDHKTDEGGVRLFKNAPPGIVFDHIGKLLNPFYSAFSFSFYYKTFGVTIKMVRLSPVVEHN